MYRYHSLMRRIHNSTSPVTITPINRNSSFRAGIQLDENGNIIEMEYLLERFITEAGLLKTIGCSVLFNLEIVMLCTISSRMGGKLSIGYIRHRIEDTRWIRTITICYSLRLSTQCCISTPFAIRQHRGQTLQSLIEDITEADITPYLCETQCCTFTLPSQKMR